MGSELRMYQHLPFPHIAFIMEAVCGKPVDTAFLSCKNIFIRPSSMLKPSVEQAFLATYDAHAEAIFRHCYFRVYDRERAKELMQEAFTKTWEYLAAGNRVTNLRAFVYKTANNLIIDHSRKKKEQSLEVMLEDGIEPGHRPDLHTAIDAKRIQESLQAVEEPYREAVYMRFIDDLTPREIADITGDNVNVISVRIHRGLKKLQDLTHSK